MEGLLARAELLLLKCGKELFFGRLEELKKNRTKGQDNVARLEGSLFAKLRRDHEERMTEEKERAIRAKLELELAEKELAEVECRITALEGVSSIYDVDDLSDTEKELHDWCEMMEKGWVAFSSLHNWMADA